MIDLPWQAALAGAVAFALTPAVRAYSMRAGLLDRPGPRRSHFGTVPRGGGPALLAALLAGSLWVPAWPIAAVAAGAVIIGLLGWREDHRPLAVRWRLLIQLATGVGLAVWWGPIDSIQIGRHSIEAAWVWTPLAVIAVIWLINLFNFMDGSDGLATTQAVLSSAMFGISFSFLGEPDLAWLAWIVGGAALGFLFWNWPRASIFLGDSGSLLLGWCMAALALGGATTGSVSVWLSSIILSPFVVDATATLAWRLMRGERWYTPHADHAYQRLIRAGWSHRRVLVGWILLNGLIVVPACILVLWMPNSGAGVAAVLGVVLTGVWALVQFVVTNEREAI